MRRLATLTLCALALPGCFGGGSASDEAGKPKPRRDRPTTGSAGVKLTELGRFTNPVFVTSEPGNADRLYIVERAGRIRILDKGKKVARPFLDIRKSVLENNEQGMMSVAFAPDYAKSRKLYVFYVENSGDIRIQEYQRARGNANLADRSKRRAVLRIRHRKYPNHYGSMMVFGRDGLLYISTGDGGGVGNPLRTAQSRRSLLGKILRIDPRRPRRGRPYRIPRTNPFARKPKAEGEILAYGLRNPYRFSLDRRTGDMIIGDVGQEAFEEVNYVPRRQIKGANFGWNIYEGRRRFRRGKLRGGKQVKPIVALRHATGNCSVIGGYVVRDRKLKNLYGRYVYGDFCTGVLRVAKIVKGRAFDNRPLGTRDVGRLSSFGEDAAGRVYAVSLGGPVFRFEPR